MKKRKKLSPFGKAVKKKVIELDMSLADLAAELDISRQQLSGILTGERPGNKYRSQIIKLLGLAEKWEASA